MRKPKTNLFIHFIFFLYLSMFSASYAQAPTSASSVSLDTVSKILQNMGCAPTASGGGLMVNSDAGPVTILMSDDKATIFIMAYYNLSGDNAKKLPALKFLQYNNTHLPYAFVTLDDNGVPQSEGLQLQIKSAMLSPTTLRSAIDNVNNSLADPLFKPSQW